MFQLLYVVEILPKIASEKQQGMVSDNADYFPIIDVSATCCMLYLQRQRSEQRQTVDGSTLVCPLPEIYTFCTSMSEYIGYMIMSCTLDHHILGKFGDHQNLAK